MEFIVEKSGYRLDKYLAEKMPGISRVKLQNAIRSGTVKVGGVPALKPSLRLKLNARIAVPVEKIISPDEELRLIPEPNIKLEIIYEDANIAVINKPAGLLIHPTNTEKTGTLANGLLAHYPEIASVGENPLRPGIIHRIDKDTSGLVIIAKNQPAFEFIKKQFLAHEIKKTYLAVTEGVPEKPEGSIDFDIRPSTSNRLKKVAVKKAGEPQKKSRRVARTLYRVLENFDKKFALLEVSPLTGRTHQIRVHLSAIGHPIVGDALYGSRSRLAKRQMLHAGSLSFTAPNGQKLSLSVPPPEDFQTLIKKIK